MTSTQGRLFDGYAIEKERVKFGPIDIEDEDVRHFKAGDGIVFVGYATVTAANVKANSSGDWVRTNGVTVHQMRVATGVMKDEIAEFYNMAGDVLPFPTKSQNQTPPQTPTSSSPTTGPAPTGSTQVDSSVALGGNTGDSTTQDSEDGEDDDEESLEDKIARASSKLKDEFGTSDKSRDPALEAFIAEGLGA